MPPRFPKFTNSRATVSKPAFVQKPLSSGWATSSNLASMRHPAPTVSKPAFVQKPLSSGWASSSSLANMRHPADMTGEELGSACVAAAREQVDSVQFWDLVADRARSLNKALEPRDLSLLLNGMSRTRQLATRPSLLLELAPVIGRKLAYFSSVQLAMTVSALSKSFPAADIPSDLTAAIVKECKSRLHEFSTGVELSMVLNGLAKLGVADSALAGRIAGVVASRLATANFHVRELCVIASALAQLGVRDSVVFEHFVARALPVAAEATPLEMARLALALAKAGLVVPLEETLSVTVAVHSGRFTQLSPKDLSGAIFGFGSVSEYMSGRKCTLIVLLDRLQAAFLGSIALFPPRELAGVLTSLARWRVVFSEPQSDSLVARLKPLMRRVEEQRCVVPVMAAVYVVAPTRLAEFIHSSKPSLVRELVTANAMTSTEWQSLAKAVAGLVETGAADPEFLTALSLCVLRNSATLDRAVAVSLRESLLAVTGPDHDLVLALTALSSRP